MKDKDVKKTVKKASSREQILSFDKRLISDSASSLTLKQQVLITIAFKCVDMYSPNSLNPNPNADR
jgi:hypothetical protein